MNSAVVFGASLWSGYALPACHPENASPRRQPAEVPLINRGNLSRQSRPPLCVGCAQIAYTAMALSWLLHLEPQTRFAAPVATGLAIAGFLAAGFLATQRRGFGLLDRFARALGRGWAGRTATGAAALHVAIAEIYARATRLWAGFALHLACWIASAIEIWLALRFMGAPLGLGPVLVIESLLYAVRSVAFAVPNAVGVQEGAYILLGASFGLTPETALALSLLKRGRDLVIGLPALGTWQLIESGRLWRRTGLASDPLETKPRAR